MGTVSVVDRGNIYNFYLGVDISNRCRSRGHEIMLLQFKAVSDGSIWLIDSDLLRYSRVSAAVTDVEKWETGAAEVEEYGELKSMNELVEVYRMVGREPTTEAPAAGLCTIALITRVLKTGTLVGVNANMPITEPVCLAPAGIECEIVGQYKQAVN